MATAAPKGTVTLMFSDIEGSTRLLRRLGDVYSDVLSMHHELVREAFGRHRGYEVDMQGDAFFVTFASAHDAVAAAADVQRALATHDWPDGHAIRIRIGLHTGEPSFVDGRYVGIDVHRGARVMAAGHGGQVLVSESTHALLDERVRLHDLGEHRLKDLAEPQRLYQLEIDGLPAEFPPLNTLENRRTNLPAPTSTFIGRERELTEVESLLAHPGVRLLTLAGTGGAGKTRLALQVATSLIEHFSSGVFFVSLSPVRDWELVVPAIARALGLREYPGEPMLDTLTDYVRDKELLLVLDNVEQVLAAGPAIAGLLALGARTSRPRDEQGAAQSVRRVHVRRSAAGATCVAHADRCRGARTLGGREALRRSRARRRRGLRADVRERAKQSRRSAGVSTVSRSRSSSRRRACACSRPPRSFAVSTSG